MLDQESSSESIKFRLIKINQINSNWIGSNQNLLTHNWRHFALRQFRHWTTDGDLQWRDVEGGHVVLTAAFVVVIDDILSDIVIRAGVLDVGLPPSVVDDKHEDQN